jgi:hypothetical protein
LKAAKIPNVNFIYAVSVWSDNQAALATSKNPVNHQRSKHFHIKYSYCQEEVNNGSVVMGYTTSSTNHADIFTKSNAINVFNYHFPFVMGLKTIPKIEHNILTKVNDDLPCPICSTSYSANK